MRTTVVILACLLFAPLASGETSPITQVAFHVPAGFGGNSSVSGVTQVLLLFDPTHGADFEGSTSSGNLVNTSYAIAYHKDNFVGGTPAMQKGPPQRTDLPGYGEFNLAFAGGASSVVIEAKSIRLEISSDSIQFGSPNAFDRRVMIPSGEPPIFDAQTPAAGVQAWRQGTGTFHLVAEGLTRIGMFGARVSCDLAPCPTGGGDRAVEGLDANSRLLIRSFESAALAGGQLNGQGGFSGLIVGGPEFKVESNGWLRLPLASGALACATCHRLANQTLMVTGHAVLSELHSSDAGMTGTFDGQSGQVRIDEASIPNAPMVLTAGISIVVVLVLASKFALTALFTKLKGDPLEHPRRRKIYEYIQGHPGATFREVARGAEIATGTTRHHLTVLKRNGVIMEKPHGSTMRFFENHGKFEANWSNVVLLREPSLKQLHDWLSLNPEVPQKDVLEAMADLGWSRSTTQHRLQRLVEGGAADLRLQGRLKIYKVAAPKMVASPGLLPLPVRAQGI